MEMKTLIERNLKMFEHLHKSPEIGERIKFRSITRCNSRTAIRKVNGFDSFGRPTVRFEGWSNFIVKPKEISEVFEAE